jgi:hypothetical protein
MQITCTRFRAAVQGNFSRICEITPPFSVLSLGRRGECRRVGWNQRENRKIEPSAHRGKPENTEKNKTLGCQYRRQARIREIFT